MLDSETTMIAATLQRLHADGQLTVAAMELATGIDRSSFYKWMDGAHDPGFTKIALLFRHCGSREVQAAILSLITSGTPWMFADAPGSADFDGDGDVDADDARKATISALKDLTEILEKADFAAPDVRTREAVDHFANKAINKLARARNAMAVVMLREQLASGKRRKPAILKARTR